MAVCIDVCIALALAGPAVQRPSKVIDHVLKAGVVMLTYAALLYKLL